MPPAKRFTSLLLRSPSALERSNDFLEPFLHRQQEFTHPAAALRYHPLLRSAAHADDLPLPRFTLQLGDPFAAPSWRVGLFTGFRPGEEGVGKALLDWVFGHQHETEPGHGYEFFAYPASDPQSLHRSSDAEPPHLLADLGHHRRRYPLHLVERELSIKEFHLVIALVRGEGSSWRASAAGPRWFENIVAESVAAARRRTDFPGVPDHSPALFNHPLTGFSRRLEGKRIQPLEVLFEIPADSERESPFPLRAALRHLFDSYRAFYVQRSDI